MGCLPFQQRPFRRDAVRARAAALACTELPCIEREGRGSEMRLDLPAEGGWGRQLVQPLQPKVKVFRRIHKKTYRKYDLVAFDELRGVFDVIHVVFMAYSCLTLDCSLFWSISWVPDPTLALEKKNKTPSLRDLLWFPAQMRISQLQDTTYLPQVLCFSLKTNPGGYSVHHSPNKLQQPSISWDWLSIS